LISPGLACTLYGFEQVAEPLGQACLAAGVALLAGFVVHARRAGAASLIDLAVFRMRVFATGARTHFLNNGVAYGGQLLVPLYFIPAAHLSPAEAGWMVAPLGVGMLCTNPSTGWLTERFGFRAVAVAGATVNTLATLPLLYMAYTAYSTPLAIASMFV